MHAPDYMLADRFGTTCGLHRRYTRRASGLPRASKIALRFCSHSPIRANHGSRASLSAFERQPMSFKHSQSPSPDGDNGNPAIHAIGTRPSLGNANGGASAPLAHHHQSVITVNAASSVERGVAEFVRIPIRPGILANSATRSSIARPVAVHWGTPSAHRHQSVITATAHPSAHRHQSVITAPAHSSAHRHQSVITAPAHSDPSPPSRGERGDQPRFRFPTANKQLCSQ